MKVIRSFSSICFFLLLVGNLFGQLNGDFRTSPGANGYWDVISWEKYDGGWITTNDVPSNSAGTITIRSDAIVTVRNDLFIDQTIVYGTLIFGSNDKQIIVTIENGMDLIIKAGGTLVHQITGTKFGWTQSSQMRVESGGTFIQNSTRGISLKLDKCTLDDGSIFIYKGSSTLIPATSIEGRTYKTLKFESTSGSWSTNSFSGSSISIFTVTEKLEIGSGVNFVPGAFNGTMSFNDVDIYGNFTTNNLTIPTGKTLSIFNGGNLTINSGNTLTLNGNLKLSSTGSITNSGTISYSPTSSSLEYAGTTQQTTTDVEFPNSNGPNTLIINNASGVVLGSSKTLNGGVNFSSGKLILGNNTLTLGSSASLTNISNDKYFVTDGTGLLKRNSITNSPVIFPVGTSSAYSPVWITNSGTSDNFSVNVESDNSGINNGNDRVQLKWNINEDVSGGTTAILKFGWMGSAEGSAFSTHRDTYSKIHHLGSVWSEAGTGDYTREVGSEPYTVSRGGIQSFSPFAVGSSETFLPVTISFFDGITNQDNVHLIWRTTMEINNSGFDIERKLVNLPFWQKVGFVQGNGNTNTEKEYVFSEKVSNGIYQYRLKQIDYNGNFEYFTLNKSISVQKELHFSVKQNYPNPFNSQTTIGYQNSEPGDFKFILYDLSGREVLKINKFNVLPGVYNLPLDLSNFSSGIYFYKIILYTKNGNFEDVKKLSLIR